MATTKHIIVVAAEGSEQSSLVGSQAGYTHMIQSLGVRSLVEDGVVSVEDYASLRDGGRYTLGPKSSKVIHVVDGRGGEWDEMLGSEAGYVRLLDRHGVHCLVNEDGCSVRDYASLEDGCSYGMGEPHAYRESHQRSDYEQQAQ